MSVQQSIRAVVWLSIVSLISAAPLFFSSDAMNVKTIDVYLFYDHTRYPVNIAYDIAEILKLIIFTHVVYSLVLYKRYKRYIMCFQIMSLLGIPAYFLFYSQGFALLAIPILLCFLCIAYLKNKNEKRSDLRTSP